MISAKKDEAEASKQAAVSDLQGKLNVMDIEVNEDEVDIDNI
jgi:hypothetical protein